MKKSRLPFALAALFAVGSATAFDLQSLISKKLMEDAGKDDMPTNTMAGDSPDNSIDPEHYVVGGGDAFQISIVGLPSQEFSPVVNQDGDLYIRDFGVITLGRISLADAKKKIKAHVEKAMKGKYQAYVTLKRIKKPVVSVFGQVNSAGTYTMAGTMRILDALKAANRGVLPAIEDCDYRQVERRNGDSLATFDLLKFIAGKGLDQNPYVYPGDNFFLRGVDRYVIVKGEINGPVEGKIPLKPGETLADILQILRPKSSMDSNYILISHPGDAGSAVATRKIGWNEAGGVALSDRDVITIGVKENFQQPATATVAGEAVRPGIYAVTEGVTTAEDLLKVSGGARQNGNAQRAYVVKDRHMLEASGKDRKENGPAAGPMIPNSFEVAVASLRKTRPEISASLNDLNVLNDYDIIDLGGHPEKVLIEKGDRLFIPKKSPYVYVSGSVKAPGAYPYQAGKDFGYYTDLAGGFTSKAATDNLFVVALYEQVAKIRDLNDIQEGDVLVVPSSIEYKTFTAVWLPILQVLPGILSLIVTVVILKK